MYAWDLPAGAGPVAARHLGAELMYYGGTVVDVALAAIVMAQWYTATGRSLARARRRPAPRSLRPAHDGDQPGAAVHLLAAPGQTASVLMTPDHKDTAAPCQRRGQQGPAIWPAADGSLSESRSGRW